MQFPFFGLDREIIKSENRNEKMMKRGNDMREKILCGRKKGKSLTRRVGALLMSLSLAATVVAIPDIGEKEVKAEELESLMLPITLLDHRDDHLLFEYDLENPLINILTMDGTDFYEASGATSPGKGLVSATLGTNGKPVYKKAVIEKVAGIIKEYIDSNPTLTYDTNPAMTTGLYDQISAKVKSDANNPGVAVLGTYTDTVTKYSVADRGLADVTTCMDYAYYAMNNFWTDTDGDLTENTDVYDYVELKKVGGMYEFTDSHPITYDTENRIITQKNSTENTSGFYPIDRSVLGDESFEADTFNEPEIYSYGRETTHNYHFGMTSHCMFVYDPDDQLEFHFQGDDDVYLFINNQLVMDIGAAHEKREDGLILNDIADDIGLEKGKIYSFDFFYLERHSWASDITIQSNIHFLDGDAIPEIQYYKDGNPLEKGDVVRVGDEVEVEYSASSGGEGLNEFTFIDSDLGVQIGKTGVLVNDHMSENILELGSTAYVKDAITVTVYDADGNVKPNSTVTISAADLNDSTSVNNFCDALGNLVVNNNEKIVLSGIYRTVDNSDHIGSDLKVIATMVKSGTDGNHHAVTRIERTETYVVDTFLVVKDGYWRLISEQYKLPAKFQDVSVMTKVYYLDCPHNTSKYTGTDAYDMIGSDDYSINIPGKDTFYNNQSTMAVSGCSDTTLYASKANTLTFTDKTTLASTEGISFDSETVFEIKYKVNYFLLKITNNNSEIRYVPVKIVADPGGVNVVGFQMNGNKSEGGVSQYNPSFRTVSKVSKVMSVGNDLYRITRFGTIFALENNLTNKATQMTIGNAEPFGSDAEVDENSVQYFEATSQGVYDQWTSGNKDQKYFDYYALTLKHWFYSYQSLTTSYSVRAYAIIEIGGEETYVYGNDIYSVTMYDIAQELYQNKKMPSAETHQYLYDNVLNPVKIGMPNNRGKIASAMCVAADVHSTGDDNYTYINQIYKDLKDYIYKTNTANEEDDFYNYSTAGAFESTLSEQEQQTFLGVLNNYSNTSYETITEWIYNQVPIIVGSEYGFYKKVEYGWDLSMYN